MKKIDKDEEEMTSVKCSICNKNMDMPKSFLKYNKKPIEHICANCSEKLASMGGKDKLTSFLSDVQKQMTKMDENNQLAEKIAEYITNKNSKSLLDELMPQKNIKKEELILESFFRGVWTTLFVMANGNEKGFLEKEAKKIKDFHEKMYKEENRQNEQ